jgi:hypothetical protein
MCLGQMPRVAHSAEGDLGKAVHCLEWPLVAYRLLATAGLLGLVALGIWPRLGYCSSWSHHPH